MRCAINVPNMGAPGALVDLAVLAETAGWDGFFVWDHLQFSRSMRLDVHDPWVILGGVAARTHRVRLGTMVTPVARRRPWKLAKEVITLDHLSNGRATLGVGLGAPADDDFAAFGEVTDDRDRARRYDEGLGVVDDILRGRVVSHQGEAYRVDAHLLPGSRQRPRPPIWVGGQVGAARPLDRALRFDGIVPVSPEGGPPSPDALAGYLDGVDLPGRFDVVCGRAPGVPVNEYAQAGATWLVESRWPTANWVAELREVAGNGPLGASIS